MKRYVWVLKGNEWQITSNKGRSFRLPDNLGMYYLTQLLTFQKQHIPYCTLVTKVMAKKPNIEFEDSHRNELLKYGFHELHWYSAIPKSDFRTIKDVAREILFAEDQIAELESYFDYGRVEVLKKELSCLRKYMRSAYNQHKRVRVFRVDEIQLYHSVKKSLQRLFKQIKTYDEDLVCFLSSKIHLHPDYIEMESQKGLEIQIRK